MDYEKVRSKFGKWDRYWKPFIESDRFDAIFRVLKARQKGITAPAAENVFKVFEVTDPDNLKVILCGICPYHTFINKVPIADGLMISSKHTGKVQPSLWHVYAEWERTYTDSIDPDIWINSDLEYLSKQGVLLYNVALTVQDSKPLSDNELWSEFNRFFWEEIISKHFKGLCIVYMGQQAHKSAAYINPLQHYHWCLSHPASAAYNNSRWSSEGVFKKIDDIILANNGPEYVVKWYQKKEWKPEPRAAQWAIDKIEGRESKEEPGDLPWE